MLFVDVAVTLVVSLFSIDGELISVRELPYSSVQECLDDRPQNTTGLETKLVYVCAVQGNRGVTNHEELTAQ